MIQQADVADAGADLVSGGESGIISSGDVDPVAIGLFVRSLGGALREISVAVAPAQALLYRFAIGERPLQVRVPLRKDTPVQSLASVFPTAAALENRLCAQDVTLAFAPGDAQTQIV